MKLEIGYNTSLEIRREFYSYSKAPGIKIMYLSDLHLNRWSGKTVDRILEVIATETPNIILLGGDYVDTNGGFAHFVNLLGVLSKHQHVFAIAGNHDKFFGLHSIQTSIELHHIQWIEKRSAHIQINDQHIQIDGSIPQKNSNENCFKILCLHQPIHMVPYQSSYQIAFAGHLHGSQVIGWQTKKGLYPGRLFYKWNIVKKEYGNCHYYIGKGLGDTLPVRFNCKKEILIIETTLDNKII